jgi:hypothetical protein
MPIRNVLVSDARRHIKHDYTALSVDVVSISEASKLLLTGSIPDIELNLAKILLLVRQCSPFSLEQVRDMVTYSGKAKRMDLNTESCDILLLELSGQMTLDEGGLKFF